MSPQPTPTSLQEQHCAQCVKNEKEIKSLREEITKINSLLGCLTKKSADCLKTVTKDRESETIQTLIMENTKMAEKIKSLDSIVHQLKLDNAQIQCILDLKQNEWQQPEANKDSDINILNGHKSTPTET